VGGVADYTAILSQRIVEESGGTVEPVHIHAGNEKPDSIDTSFPLTDLSGQCSSTALADTIEQLSNNAGSQVAVLLEYSGYGYASRGAPFWLARGLEQVCGTGGIPLITMFHEVSASGPIWTSAFWLSPLQSWIARRIGRLSSALMTTHPLGARGLQEGAKGNSSVEVRPAFSNVGEPNTNPPWEQRDCLVLFGGQKEKEQIYDNADQLRRLVAQNSICRLVDIGPPPGSIPSFDVPCDVLGVQPAEAVSEWLGRGRLGIVHRRLDVMTKSGLVAAYLAHGVPLVVLPHGPSTRSPILEEGTHYLTMDRACAGSVDAEHLSRRGYEWYQSQAHTLKQARAVCRMVRVACESSSKS
jgi:hypothetical protein